MDTWLYGVLKCAMDLHKISDPQAEILLNRIIQIIFSDDNDTNNTS